MAQTVLQQAHRFTTPKGAGTRRRILKLAVEFATLNGLEALTIGRLAEEAGMSKSGIFAHFGSKEELQLATVAAAGVTFAERVLAPAGDTEPGIVRLYQLWHGWLGWVEENRDRGGCFFAAASTEFDGRPGRVRDRLVDLTKSWLVLLEQEARDARDRGELQAGTDPRLLAFAAHAYVEEANWANQLLEVENAFTYARTAFDQRVQSSATEDGLEKIANMKPSKR